MISRLAAYHRWRRFQVCSFTYQILLVLTVFGMVALIWAVVTPG